MASPRSDPSRRKGCRAPGADQPPREGGPVPAGTALALQPAAAAPPANPEALERCLAELVRYYRHSGVGRLCRGIIHRMNTPLQVLSFQLELLEQKTREEQNYLAQGPPDAAQPLLTLLAYRTHKLRQFRGELQNLQDLARNLMVQGVHEENQEQLYLDLNRICERELELYASHPDYKHRVHQDVRLEKSLPPLYGYYIDFSQSIRNLVDNALEAMAGAVEQKLTVQTAVQDRGIILRVGDTGEGIPPENLPQIWQPFFTTRGPDRAGLGLFMVRRLLAPYEAQFRATSRPGETWIEVHLPAR